MSWNRLKKEGLRHMKCSQLRSLFTTKIVTNKQSTVQLKPCIKGRKAIFGTCLIRNFSSSIPNKVNLTSAIKENGLQCTITTENGKILRLYRPVNIKENWSKLLIKHLNERQNHVVEIATEADHTLQLVVLCVNGLLCKKSAYTLHVQESFPSVWLRFNCHCSGCRQHEVGAKTNIDPAEVNIYTTIKSTRIDHNGCVLKIAWTDHEGEIPIEFLMDCHLTRRENSERQSWKATRVLPIISYQAMIESKYGVLEWLRKINDEGVCLLTNVPTEQSMVKKVAEYIGPIQETIYGTVMDVKAEAQPINIACTNDELPLHMDLLWYESPPGIQFFHCMQFDECVEGGDSILLDVFHVAEMFRNDHPDDFKILTEIPVVFERIHYKRDRPVNMAYMRPHIILNEMGEIITVNWATHQEGPMPLSISQDDLMLYYKAHHRFARAIKYSQDKIKIRLQPGDALAFSNRRMLHGRSQFQLNGGGRWFESVFVLFDEFVSQLKILSRETGDKRPHKNTGWQV